MLIPAALFAVLVYAVYQFYLMQDPNYEKEQEPSSPSAVSTAEEAVQQPASGDFSDQDEAEIQRQFKNFSSPDYQVSSGAWQSLAPLMKKNPALFRDRMIEAMNRSSSRHFILQAAWGLCVHYGEGGKQAVIRLAVKHKEDPSILYAIDDALKTLGANDRATMRNRVRQALEDVRSPFAERFSR